ncbi:hypothetical protein CONLIGDRAFT_645972 [Coniochaeta ligniaria NRRL 30616]|uniref:Uncharacterized protein n=1 Tax=Coniochaeta ligniaria NRRL 30616 TaxID=1408157 RepID=A0A1J7IK03_9PEZI|nr:hypothetical protein CONLIGDRAFT_645972 [Coniochaeta ligniaria NRRL 30616]
MTWRLTLEMRLSSPCVVTSDTSHLTPNHTEADDSSLDNAENHPHPPLSQSRELASLDKISAAELFREGRMSGLAKLKLNSMLTLDSLRTGTLLDLEFDTVSVSARVNFWKRRYVSTIFGRGGYCRLRVPWEAETRVVDLPEVGNTFGEVIMEAMYRYEDPLAYFSLFKKCLASHEGVHIGLQAAEGQRLVSPLVINHENGVGSFQSKNWLARERYISV